MRLKLALKRCLGQPPPPVSVLCFLPATSAEETDQTSQALVEGLRNFLEGAFSGLVSQCCATVRHCRCYTRCSATPFNDNDIDMANLRCYTPPPKRTENGETTIKITFLLLRGGGGELGTERKIVQNAVFRGKRHDNEILKVQILLSSNFVVIAQAPTKEQKRLLQCPFLDPFRGVARQ